MKKDYSNLTGAQTSKLLSKDLFYISIDTIASMYLSGIYESYLDSIDGVAQTLDAKQRKCIYVTIYDLVKLYSGGHRIELINMDDVMNVYNLIHRHLENVENLISGSINPVKLKDAEGLTALALLADEILANNINHITKEMIGQIENKPNMFTKIGISSGSFMDKYYAKNNIAAKDVYASRNSSSLGQHEISLNTVKKRILDLD